MAALIVGGVTVLVSAEGVPEDVEEIGGSRQRMFDGTMRQTVRGRKDFWRIPTRLMTASQWTTLRAALVGTPPVTCSGDVLGASTSCFVKIDTVQQVWTRGQIRYRVNFTLFQQ